MFFGCGNTSSKACWPMVIRAEHLLDLGRVVDAGDHGRLLVAGRGLDRELVADRQVLVVGVRLRPRARPPAAESAIGTAPVPSVQSNM